MRSVLILISPVLVFGVAYLVAGHAQRPMPLGTAMQAASCGNLAGIREFVARGGHINARDESGSTLLIAAVLARRPDAARAIIKMGADVSLGTQGGFTPLMFAAANDDPEMAQLLLARGATARARNPGRKTALTIARESEHADVAALIELASSDHR